VASFFDFEGVPEEQRLTLLNNRDYQEYPHAHLSVPTEAEVEEAVLALRRSREEISTEIVRRKGGRQGVRQVVAEILERKTVVDESGYARWEN
jgi:3-hydroxyisobutyryl-CoA hydrolase